MPNEQVKTSILADPKEAWVELAQSEDAKWHWCLWSKNSKALCMNVEGFARQNDCWSSFLASQKTMIASPSIKKVITMNKPSRRGRRKSKPNGEPAVRPATNPPMTNPLTVPDPPEDSTEV